MSALATMAKRLGAAGIGRGTLLPVATLAIVGLMVVPIPPFVLDCFFIFNIAVSLAVLMVALKTERPLDFSAFPTVLLFTTMLRLALNVASTRAVLVNGHTGTAVAGHVIEAFGKFLIGGDFIVGLFVFVIITIINVTVITKGAGRVSEVSARFTLDALPGKQMAIDADLNAGVLTADEAKARRADVALEADFYGSMDGASKFTKGDAVAGIIILVVNIIGGLLLGTISHGLSIGDAASQYILLAIGDGLVAQVPALLLSLAAAVIVTRVSSPLDLTGQVLSQFHEPGAWVAVAATLALLAMLPGMPHLLAFGAAGIAGFIAWRLSRSPPGQADAPTAERADTGLLDPGVGWDEVTDHSQAGLEIGYGLIELVDEAKRAPLIARVTGVRKQLSRELGFVLPPVRVRDNMDLPPLTYRIVIGGTPMAEDEARPGELLALDPGTVVERIVGRAVKDPSFGLPALWIAAERQEAAIAAGFTVVDCATVIATHLAQVLQGHAHKLFGQDDAQRLLDSLQGSARALVTGLVPKALPLATFTAALQCLIEDGVPIREFRRVVEAAAANAHRTADAVELAEMMRPALADLIVARLAGVKEPLRALTLEDGLEQLILASVRADPGSPWPIEPGLARRIGEAAAEAALPLNEAGTLFALIVAPGARRALARVLRHRLIGVPVLSYADLPEAKPVRVMGVIGAAAAAAIAGPLAEGLAAAA